MTVEDFSRENEAMKQWRQELAEAREEVSSLIFALRGAGLAAFEYAAETRCWRTLGGSEDPLGAHHSRERPFDAAFELLKEPEPSTIDQALLSAAIHGAPVDMPLTVSRNDGQDRQLRLIARGTGGGSGRVTGVVLDETEPLQRKSALSLRTDQDLLKELTHRLGNIFPSILTIIRMTAENHVDGASFAADLEHRISALALTHRVLAQRNPSASNIDELLRLNLAPYGADDRVTLFGPHVSLTGGMAESFGIIIHELIANSAQHGALKLGSGQIDVAWHSTPNGAKVDVMFEWVERNGRPVDLASKNGFGSAVLGFDGTPIVGSGASLQATHDGLRYTLTLHVDRD